MSNEPNKEECITIIDGSLLSKEEIDIISRINKLSDGAVTIAGSYNFCTVLAGKPYLIVSRNEEQESHLEELLDVGFCHGDVERGIFGYRSTFDGREAGKIIRTILT